MRSCPGTTPQTLAPWSENSAYDELRPAAGPHPANIRRQMVTGFSADWICVELEGETRRPQLNTLAATWRRSASAGRVTVRARAAP